MMFLLGLNPLADWLVFPLFEVTALSLFVYAVCQDAGFVRPDGMTDAQEQPGEGSRIAFYAIYGMFAFFLVQIVNVTTSSWGEETKTFWHLFHFTALAYLAFFSAWGRAAASRIVNAFRRWPER